MMPSASSSNRSSAKTRFQRLAIALLFGLSPVLSGCVAVAAGGAAASGVAYLKGDLEAHLEARHHVIFRAIEESVESFGFFTLESVLDGASGRIVVRNTDDQKITYRVKPLTEGVSTLNIRVGTFGDEALSRDLLSDVRARLNLR